MRGKKAARVIKLTRSLMKALKPTITILIFILLLSAQPLLATDPQDSASPWTYIEPGGEGTSTGIPSGRPRAYFGESTTGPGYGSSVWTYADSYDTTAKVEGSYAA